jgi:hypothetical protein
MMSSLGVTGASMLALDMIEDAMYLTIRLSTRRGP